MKKKRNRGLMVVVGCIVVALIFIGWFLGVLFEGEKPRLEVESLPDYIAGEETLRIHLRDSGRGLRSLKVLVVQGGRDVEVLTRDFPFQGLMNSEGVRAFETDVTIDPEELNLAQGRAELNVLVRDYSSRRGGDGNLGVLMHEMVVDTIPPSVRTLSRMHNVNLGGAGLVVYETSLDTVESGVYVDELFFRGYEASQENGRGYHVCYFGIPPWKGTDTQLSLWAKDRAGNETRGSFYYHLREKRFSNERANISDPFLNRILPYFSFYKDQSENTRPIERFVRINSVLRKENNRTFFELRDETGADRLWEGAWLRMKNAATMAVFGEKRAYYYRGRVVDRQTHLGVDLASLANSDVQAANNGRVIYADRLGIYGNTVVLDHGQGLASVYSHLSGIRVETGRNVVKGDVIGVSGTTGLAGGDHLHFGVMAGGVFVNPVEWWDPHWIRDNVTGKLAVLKK